jgi:signal transduction histidine kinase
LLGITAKLNSKLDLDNVLHALLEETTTIMETEGAFVILFDEGVETYQVVATYSVNDELHKYKGEEFQLAQHEITAITDGELSVRVFSDKNDSTLHPYRDLLSNEEIFTLALAPLQSDNHPLGVMLILSMEDTKSYSDDDLHFLKGLADQASLAITNARLFQNVNHSRFRLQILSKRLVEIQEAERRSLARELHDQIGQMLTGLQFTLESGKRNSPIKTQHIFEESQEIISDLIKQVRDISLRLLPSMLEDIGLLPTLQWHFDQFTKQTDIEVNFSYKDLKDKRFSPTLEITAYRIIQEGLTNVARYAQVKLVDVNIGIEDSVIRLDISDQGIGFDPEKTISTRQSFGLIGMRERVLQIGGDLMVNAAPGKGTQLEAHLPLKKNHVERRKYAR